MDWTGRWPPLNSSLPWVRSRRPHDISFPLRPHVHASGNDVWLSCKCFRPWRRVKSSVADYLFIYIKAFYQDPEVWEYLNYILKESSESLNRWTVIEKRVCSERTPSIYNMFDISRTPDSFGEHLWDLKRIILWDHPCPFDKLSSFDIRPCMTLERDVSINHLFRSKVLAVLDKPHILLNPRPFTKWPPRLSKCPLSFLKLSSMFRELLSLFNISPGM
jgi:hypothetical protein